MLFSSNSQPFIVSWQPWIQCELSKSSVIVERDRRWNSRRRVEQLWWSTHRKLAGNWLVLDVFSRTLQIELYLCFSTVWLKSERSVGSLELTGNFTLSSISSDYCSKRTSSPSEVSGALSLVFDFVLTLQSVSSCELWNFVYFLLYFQLVGSSQRLRFREFAPSRGSTTKQSAIQCLVYKRLQTQLWK